MERPTEAVRLDGDSGFHRGEAQSLPANTGGNQAWLHASKNAENKGKINPAVFNTLHYNVWGAFAGNNPNTGLGVYLGDPIWGETKESAVVKPAEMISLGDSNWDLKQQGDRDWSGFIGMYEERQWPLEVHGKRAAIAYCDGHVESKRRLDLIGQLNKTPGARQKAATQWNRDNKPHFQ